MVTLNKEDKSVLNDLLLGTGSKKWAPEEDRPPGAGDV